MKNYTACAVIRDDREIFVGESVPVDCAENVTENFSVGIAEIPDKRA